jgi:hypothetical protein
MLDDYQLDALERIALRADCTPSDLASIVSDEDPPLTASLQVLAQRYLDAQRRSGVALLEAAATLAEARAQTRHGEWYLFLRAIQTSDDAAERLLAIHRTVNTDAAFAEAIRSNRIALVAAALLARPSTPSGVREQLIAAPGPLSVRTVRRVLRTEPRTRLTLEEMRDDARIGEVIAVLDGLGDILKAIPECIQGRDSEGLIAALERARALRAKGIEAARLIALSLKRGNAS